MGGSCRNCFQALSPLEKPHTINHPCSFLDNSALLTITTAQSLLPHLVPVFMASMEKHFEPCKMTSNRGSDSSNFGWHWRQPGKLRMRSESACSCTKRRSISRISSLPPHPSCPEWPCEIKLMHVLGTAPAIPTGYAKTGFWVTGAKYICVYCREGSSARELGHATTLIVHQAHKQPNQALLCP